MWLYQYCSTGKQYKRILTLTCVPWTLCTCIHHKYPRTTCTYTVAIEMQQNQCQGRVMTWMQALARCYTKTLIGLLMEDPCHFRKLEIISYWMFLYGIFLLLITNSMQKMKEYNCILDKVITTQPICSWWDQEMNYIHVLFSKLSIVGIGGSMCYIHVFLTARPWTSFFFSWKSENACAALN